MLLKPLGRNRILPLLVQPLLFEISNIFSLKLSYEILIEKPQGKQCVHKSVDPSLARRKFLQATFFMLIMSKYLGLLYCRWSGVFLFLCSDAQIRKVFCCVTRSHGRNQIGKEPHPPTPPPGTCGGVKYCASSCCYNRKRCLSGVHSLRAMTLLQQDADEMQFPMCIGQEAVIFFQIPKKKKMHIKAQETQRAVNTRTTLNPLYLTTYVYACV